MVGENRIPKSLFYAAFVTTILACLGVGTIVVVMGVGGWFGFDNGTPITISSCPDTYPIVKFGNQNTMLRAAFVLGLIACTCLVTVLFMMIAWLTRVCKEVPPSQAFQWGPKVLLYFLVNLSLICIIPIFGYFAAFEAELNECTTSFSTGSRRFILIGLCFMLPTLLILWMMTLAMLCKDEPQSVGEKYKQIVHTHPTEPNEQPVQQVQHQSVVRRVEETRENIYQESPPRRQYELEPRKEEESPPRQAQVYYSKDNESPPRNAQVYYKESPKFESRVKSSAMLEPKSKYESSRRDADPYYRSRSKYEPSDDYDSFRHAQKNYLGRMGSRYANPLKKADDPSQGELTYHKPKERSRNGLFNEFEKSSNKSNNKEGLLLNRIRGKYQN